MPATANSGRQCLIVDDEPPLRALLRRLMEGEGFVCREASSGDEALALLRADPVPLVLSDFHMPHMDGGALLRAVRAHWPDTAVVMITAVSDVDIAVRCRRQGAGLSASRSGSMKCAPA
jgi:CheY-like chemotaxis protein